MIHVINFQTKRSHIIGRELLFSHPLVLVFGISIDLSKVIHSGTLPLSTQYCKFSLRFSCILWKLLSHYSCMQSRARVFQFATFLITFITLSFVIIIIPPPAFSSNSAFYCFHSSFQKSISKMFLPHLFLSTFQISLSLLPKIQATLTFIKKLLQYCCFVLRHPHYRPVLKYGILSSKHPLHFHRIQETSTSFDELKSFL